MVRFRLLPWEYGVRNLFRRPLRSGLTLGGLTLVILLVFIVVGFIRGLEVSLDVSGDPRVVLIHGLGGGENLENSSLPGRTAALLSASLEGVQRRNGVSYASPELYLGTRVGTEDHPEPSLGVVRGVTGSAILVRQGVQVTEGRWPQPGEVIVGRLAATKLGSDAGSLAVGKTIMIEGRSWKISGWFAAVGSTLESELWCPLEDLQQAMKRQDLSLVAVTLAPGADFAVIDEFCKERLDLELQATAETTYYASLQKHYKPVRTLAWLVMCLVAGSGVFAGLNTMYGAIVLSLVQEGTLLAAAGALIAAILSLCLINGAAVRFTNGAFVLRIDSLALLLGCGTGLLLGMVGSLPPAIKAMRLSIVEGLKSI